MSARMMPVARMGAARRLAVVACVMIAVGLSAVWAGCGRDASSRVEPLARLDGRLVLPADTFSGQGLVGAGLDTIVNDRHLPLAAPPVQGFSSLLRDGPDLLALQDNGLGTLANSADSPLRWYRLRPDWKAGLVAILGVTNLTDPHRLLPFALARPGAGRALSGADLDPEAFVAMPDGTMWIGEEFGPSLVHVDADGVMLEKPVMVPVPPALRGFARGSPYLRTPDHPDLRFLNQDQVRRDLANLPRSGGIEGLAHDTQSGLLYAALEKGLVDDPDGRRRLIAEFDPTRHGFTGAHWFYRVHEPGVSIASFDADGARGFLVLERDGGEGRAALVKRIYRVELGRIDAEGFLVKSLVCDLLALADPRGLTHRERGAVGLGRRFSFPFMTPECLVVVDDSTLIVANDNNYPFSSGRRPGEPDDNEIVRLILRTPLNVSGAAAVATAPAD